MMDKPEAGRLKYLADKWLAGTISTEEKNEFNEWYLSFDDHIVVDYTADELTSIENELYHDIQIRSGMVVKTPKYTRQKFKAIYYWAASLIAICAIAAIFYERNIISPVNRQAKAEVIIPGSEKGNLKLGSDRFYNLVHLKKGVFLKNNGVEIKKIGEGELIYTQSINHVLLASQVIDNTVSTPNGGQYKLHLSDGTKIWLNAASEIKFPIAFVGDKRIVELKGEAYFEVAEDKKRPFIVRTQKEAIRVLGTHFNVNAYDGEPRSVVSLLSGRVTVTGIHSQSPTVLSPGQQAVNGPNSISVEPFDIEESIAWKNGEFVFNNERLDQVMLRVGRWYDVQVYVDPEIAKILIWGSISKSAQIEKVLKLIQMTNDNIAYRIAGRRVYMIPK